MSQNNRELNWKARLQRGRQSSFIGREVQLQAFRSTLSTYIEERSKPIFNISGQGGIGKTTLLQQFRKITVDLEQVAVYVNEGIESNRVDNVPEVIDRLVKDFEQQGYKFDEFRERYKTFRQKKQEIEADPEAPQGIVAGIGKVTAKAGLGAVKFIPGIGDAMSELINIDAVADKAGDLASFAWSKFRNKDDVELVTQPLEVLTPLFLKDLNQIAEKKTVVLLFDTYEETSVFLDDWLRAVLIDYYGKMPHNFLLAIAGREPLNWNNWTEFENCIARSELKPFSQEETRQYLANKGITDESVIQEIWRLSSGGLPLLVDMMAQAAPKGAHEVLDFCEEAVERFLKWEIDPVKRQLAMEAAIPRVLDRDVLGLLVEEATLHDLFEWLKSRSFVMKHPEGWEYHAIVREQMLLYQRKVSQKDWAKLHGRLSAYYDELRQSLALEEEKQRKDEIWRKYTLEWLYHSLCANPKQQLATALNGWLAALKASRAFAWEWAEVMVSIKDGVDCVEVKQWGERLQDGLQAYQEEHYEPAIEMFSALLKAPQVEAQWHPVALDWRGVVYWHANRYELSLQDLNEAISLAPEEAEYWLDRGKTYHWMEHYNQALENFDKAISLYSDNSDIYGYRSQTYRELKKYEQAIEDANQAIKLNEKSSFAWVNRGVTHQLMRNYDAALSDFDRAIQLDENYTGAIKNRGETHRLMKNYDAALSDFDCAIQLDETSAWAIASRGQTYKSLERYEEAIIDFNRAIELDPDSAWKLTERGITYFLVKSYDAALVDLDYAMKLDENNIRAIAFRGETHRVTENYAAALADFDRIVQFDENQDYLWVIVNRGLIYKSIERYEEAIADFNRAIELDPDSAWIVANRGEARLALSEYEQALADFNYALTLEPKSNWKQYTRALAYLALNQVELAQADLIAAIQQAKAEYDQNPTDWCNIFNLALYYLVNSQIDEAEMLYGFASDAPNNWVRMAIRDLRDLLVVFPSNTLAQQMLQQLESIRR